MLSFPSSDLLAAYDAAVEALAGAPSDIRLKHNAVLTLARAGSTQHARREYVALGLDAIVDHEDVLALGGRILKDLSLAARGDVRRKLAALSAAKYLQAYALHQGHYPGINTATMFLLAGETPKAREIAAAVLPKLKALTPESAQDAYYAKATAAEALLLMGDSIGAEAHLHAAIACDPGNVLARATTLRQFKLICAALRLDAAWLAAHRPQPALFFSGHMFNDQGPEAHVAALTADIKHALDQLKPGAGFGALAAGTDILIAEALLERSADVHIVLPFLENEFIAQSVAPFGPSWVARYHAVRRKAASFRLATHETTFSDDSVFTHGADYAMGLALHHADMLCTQAVHLAAWDGAHGTAPAGTATDIARWKALGHAQTIVPFPSDLRAHKALIPVPAPQQSTTRAAKAILFGDVRGFSKLDETHIRAFVDHVMRPLAETMRAQTNGPELVATWGDGFHLVYDTVEDAADAALAAQERFASFDLASAGLPDHLALRIGGHVGPVAQIVDPFLNAPSFYGTQITLAARIEPVAVPGTVYVSEPFAAVLALRTTQRFRTDYAGQIELAKNFGAMRLFALRRDAVD